MNNLGYGLQIMAIGFSVVILVLIMLYLILLVFNYVFTRGPTNKNAASLEPKKKQRKTNSEENIKSAELIAAITAAVTVVMEDTVKSFRINNIKQTNDNLTKWANQGRRFQLEQSQQLAMVRRLHK